MKRRFLSYPSMGFTVVELMLAISILLILATGTTTTILGGLDSNRLGEEQTVASQYAAEGIEAVRSIKNRGYNNLINNSSLGIQQSGDTWTFSESENLLSNKYNRAISISDVQRDCELNIVESGGIIDPNTKLITSKVSWDFSPLRQNQVELKSYLTNWKDPILGNSIGEKSMMIYAKNTNIPYYRLWSGSDWGEEFQAQPVGGNINYIDIKTLPARNEAILGTMDSNGNLYVQAWQGLCTGASLGTPELLGTVGAESSIYKSYDIAYEKNTNRAIVAYLHSPTSSDLVYRIWDGDSWSDPTIITLPPTTGIIRWIEMTQNPNPTSNEISLIMVDSNKDVYGMIWNGTSWDDMGTSTIWDTTSSTTSTLAIAVEYEQISNQALFVWGDEDRKKQNYRTWNGSSLSPISQLTINNLKKESYWIQLASRDNSDEIMLGVVDFDRGFTTRIWSGSSWDSASNHPLHGNKLETRTSKGFDIAWEAHPSNLGKAWIVFTDNNSVNTRQWSGSSWGTITDMPGSDDSGYVTIVTDPKNGAIFASATEDRESTNNELWEMHLSEGGSVWSTKATVWNGPTSGTPDYFRVGIAPR